MKIKSCLLYLILLSMVNNFFTVKITDDNYEEILE